MTLDYKAIGKRIKIARINANMTQDQLCERANLSPSHMSNIETGSAKMSLTMIVGIANALSLTVDDLLCDNIVRARPQFERDIQQIIDDCDEYELRIVKNVAHSVLKTLRANEKLKNNGN